MAAKSNKKNIKCISCKYARADESASDRLWTAYECGNVKSDFYKSLLNITPEGNKLERISWRGCESAERRVKA